jgi:GNAT superfamily N-acetyltransferase
MTPIPAHPRTSAQETLPDYANIPAAIEAFVHGFAFTRSFTHPYLPERVGPLWVMRDAPRTAGDYRNEEWVANGVAPAEVDRIVRQASRGRYAICAIRGDHEPEPPLRDGYKALGYRLGRTEPLMVHALRRIPRFDSPVPIERVMDADLADRLAKAARSRQILPEHFRSDAPLRQYVALDGKKPIGWVRSIVAGDATWCSNMYVEPKFRRRGVARAMLARMLRDDRAAGAKAAVLLASHAGAKLYPVVGYEQIGMLLLFTPRKRA